MLRLIRHTLRFPLLGGMSLLMAIACASLVLVLPGVTMRFIDTVIEATGRSIVPTALIGAGAILARQILFALRSYLNSHLELKLTHVIRVELYDKLQRLPVKWFDNNSSGGIMSRVADDVPTTNRVIVEGLDQALAAILQFIIVMGYLLYHSWELTLVTLLPLPFIGALTAWWSKKAEPKWAASSEASSALNAILHDNLAGIRQIKAYTVEPQALSDFDQASRAVGDRHMAVIEGPFRRLARRILHRRERHDPHGRLWRLLGAQWRSLPRHRHRLPRRMGLPLRAHLQDQPPLANLHQRPRLREACLQNHRHPG